MPDEVNVANEVRRLFDEKAPAILWHCSIPKDGTMFIRGEFFFSGPHKEHMVHIETNVETGTELSDETLKYIMDRLIIELARALLEWKP